MSTMRILNPGWFKAMNNRVLAAVLAASAVSGPLANAQALQINGAGWFQFGRVEHSTNYVTNNINDYNKNWMQTSGAQVGATLKIDENWEGAMALGMVQVHLIRGARSNGNWYPFTAPYVGEARITYSTSVFSAEDKLQVTAGNFGYGYNPDAHNLGQYLMRGYVYPGALVSGFGNIQGAMVRYARGGFRNDLILKSEVEDKPQYDFSVADVVNYRVMPGFEVGAGVNFYRLLAQNPSLTSPGKNCEDQLGPYAGPANATRNPCYTIDSSGAVPDTVTGSLAGTKLMARFSFDPKQVFGLTGLSGRSWGAKDWVIYGEAALLGIKDYPNYYDDKLRRLPVMAGFNIPTLGYLDDFSVEIEYYASKNSSDNLAAQSGSWVPVENPAVNNARDDWKWSVQAGKVLWGNLKLTAQVANDHSRLGGSHDLATGVEAYTTPEDWYWTGKLAYFF